MSILFIGQIKVAFLQLSSKSVFDYSKYILVKFCAFKYHGKHNYSVPINSNSLSSFRSRLLQKSLRAAIINLCARNFCPANFTVMSLKIKMLIEILVHI